MGTLTPGMMWIAAPLLADSLSIFDPASPSAQSIFNLAILILAITGLIFVIVEGVLFYSLWRFRIPEADEEEPKSSEPVAEPAQVYGSMPIEIAWTAAPTLIVVFLVLVSARTLWEVKPNIPESKPGDGALYVTVIGHQWWWEYRYETYDGRPLGFITANELHIPVDSSDDPHPTYLKIISEDVCHSFWVPRLGGKMDAVPGLTNHLVLSTTEEGLHLGQCAEFCGAQHANMLIRVIAQPLDKFEEWLTLQAQPAKLKPGLEDAQKAFLAESCINCHRVRGTPADGSYAPDLTHLMSRETIAGGMIANTPKNLHQWIKDPQIDKPGCLMPDFGLDEKQLNLIFRYLNSLD